ncbi:MAG: hypothetical protein ACF8XB_20445 [Planctomycetota bacterium JB042]
MTAPHREPNRDDEQGPPGRSTSDDRVVLYVDGGLGEEARRAFEVELSRSEVLRDEVRRARLVRRLVAGLPRVPAAGLPTASELLERAGPRAPTAAAGADASDGSAGDRVAALLGGLRRHAPPPEIGARFRAFVAAEAASARSARVRRAIRRPVPVATWAAAAALLLVSGVFVFSAPPPRPSGSRIPGVTFRFEVARGVPGRPVDAGAATSGLLSVPAGRGEGGGR